MPADRKRRYSAGGWKPYVVFLDCDTFKDRFFRDLKTNASIFLNGDPRHQLPSSSFYPTALKNISSAESTRCEDYLAKCRAKGLCNEDREWAVEFALVDVTQNANFRSVATNKFPALLRRTKLWDMVTDSPVGEVPLMLCQGFPHPHAIGLDEKLKREFPFTELLEMQRAEPAGKRRKREDDSALSPLELASLVGNSMHWAAVGSWIGHILCSIDFVPPPLCSDA